MVAAGRRPSDTRSELAASFLTADTAAAYAFRPPYPPDVFDVLDSLVEGQPRRVLDIGAGDGALARPLARRVAHVDALEISPAMVAAGKRRPGGNQPNITWIVQAVEHMTVGGPYSLVTAGASLHWMEWEPTLERVGQVLAPGAVLAIVDQNYCDLPWQDAVRDIIVHHSRNPSFDPSFSLPDELCRQNLFVVGGRWESPSISLRQRTEEYVEQFHSTASLARVQMPPEESARFRAEVESIVRRYQDDQGYLPVSITASVAWGLPASPGDASRYAPGRPDLSGKS